MANTTITDVERATLMEYGNLTYELNTQDYPSSTLEDPEYQAKIASIMDMICRIDTLPEVRPAYSQTTGWLIANVFGGAPIPAWLVLIPYDSQYDSP